MESCADCVSGAEFFGAIVVGVVSFVSLVGGMRLYEGYARNKRVEEWTRWVIEEKRKKQRNDR